MIYRLEVDATSPSMEMDVYIHTPASHQSCICMVARSKLDNEAKQASIAHVRAREREIPLLPSSLAANNISSLHYIALAFCYASRPYGRPFSTANKSSVGVAHSNSMLLLDDDDDGWNY